MTDLSDPATPEEIAIELASVIRHGATPRSLMTCQSILALAVVRARAASDGPADRASAAHALLRQLAAEADDEARGPTATILGLAAGTRGALLKDRRRLAAIHLHISPSHFRTSGREIRLVAALASELHAADSAYRLRHEHRLHPEREPINTRIGISWYELHKAYRRVWTPVAALRDDLEVLLRYLRADTASSDVADRTMVMSWRLAQFAVELDRFVEERGGLWLLADVESEIAAADAIRDLGVLLPFGDSDLSFLRMQLKAAEHRELELFADGLHPAERGREIAGVWVDWARGCQCNRASPGADVCSVHRWTAAADTFIRLIDDDWYRVADWYRGATERR